LALLIFSVVLAVGRMLFAGYRRREKERQEQRANHPASSQQQRPLIINNSMMSGEVSRNEAETD